MAYTREWLDPWQAEEVEHATTIPTYGMSVARQNGKTAVAEQVEVEALNVGRRVLHTAHEVKTSRKAFLRLVSLVEGDHRCKTVRHTNGQEAVLFDNGGSVEFVARSKSSGRGYTVDTLVCDEAQEITEEQLSALLPTISAGVEPRLILLGTPPTDETGVRGGPFRRIREEAQTDPEVHFSDYGLPDGPLPDNLRSMELAERHNPAMATGRLHAQEVRREQAMMGDRAYARERLGWWGDPAEKAIPTVLPAWAECERPLGAVPRGLGVAIDSAREWVTVMACGSGHLTPLAREAVADTSAVVKAITEWVDTYGGLVALDRNGPASTMVTPLEEAGVTVLDAGTPEYVVSCALFYDHHLTHQLTHNGYDVLDGSVLSASWRQVGEQRVFARIGDSSPLEAAVWATYADREAGAFL